MLPAPPSGIDTWFAGSQLVVRGQAASWPDGASSAPVAAQSEGVHVSA